MGTSIDYSTVSHETIYQHITGGPGYAGMMEMSRGWQSVATQMQQFRSAVEQAVRGIGAAQQGVAADAATHSTSALMPWLDESVTAANRVAARVSEQADSFAHTRDSMPPPRAVPEVSFLQDPATWTADHAIEWLPGIQTQNEAARVAAQQDEQRARELMGGYQGTSNDNLAVREHFVAAPTVVAEVVDPTPGGVGVGGGSDGGFGGGSGGGSAQSAPGGVRAALAHAGPVSGGHGVPAHAAPVATASQLASGAVATTPQLAGGYPSPAGQSMAGSGSVGPVAADPFGPSPILAATNGTDQVRGGSRYSAGGGVPRAGSFGPRPTAFSGGGSHVSELRLSNPADYGSGEPAGAGRAARGGGWGDAPLGAPTGSGRDGDRREHRRASYLIEQDTNAIVGELPRTAQPVIGAEEDYR
ncbi:MAG: PPE domain-containing protein [Pseudonocardiaceae bacterium]